MQPRPTRPECRANRSATSTQPPSEIRGRHPGTFRRIAVVALLAPLGFAQVISALSPTQQLKRMSLEDLMDVKVVTATQVTTDAFDLPFSLAIRTSTDAERLLPRSFPMLLDGIPGVMIQKTAAGQMSPYLRGFTGFRTLLLVDGIRLNNSFFREGPNQYASTIDLHAIDRVEVVLGPASVLYGSDSIGGTINALSRRLLDSPPAAWTRSAHYRFATAEDSQTARLDANGPLGEKAALHIGGTHRWIGELKGGSTVGRQKHTDFDESGFDTRFEAQLTPGLRLTVAHQQFDQSDVWRSHSTPEGTRWMGLVPGTDRERSLSQHRALSYANLEAPSLGASIDDLLISLSLHQQDEDQVRVRNTGRRETATASIDTFGAVVQAQTKSRFGHWLYGFNYYRDQVDTAGARYLADGTFDRAEVQGPVADDSTYELLGVYVQDKSPRWGPLQITTRARYDRASAHAGRLLEPISGLPTTFSGQWQSLVGSARASLSPESAGRVRWLAFAGASQGFRAPNLSDLSRLDSAGANQIETPSTQVRPEYYTIYEIGAKLRHAQFEFSTTIFHTEIDGMISRTPTGNLIRGLAEVTKRNSGSGYVRGGELDARLQVLPALWLKATSTMMRGDIDVYPGNNATFTVREPVSRLMPATTRFALDWTPPQQSWRLDFSCTTAARQSRLSSIDRADTERIPPGGTPGYTVFDFRATWQPRPNLKVSAGIENLTDRDYRIHGSGINEPGRNLTIGGTFRF